MIGDESIVSACPVADQDRPGPDVPARRRQAAERLGGIEQRDEFAVLDTEDRVRRDEACNSASSRSSATRARAGPVLDFDGQPVKPFPDDLGGEARPRRRSAVARAR